MKFTKIIANPPFGKIGVDITNIIMNEIPHQDIVILGTRAMLCKHNERLELEYVYIEDYILEPATKCKWVQQIVLLGCKGRCKVVPTTYYGSSSEVKPNEIRFAFSEATRGKSRMLFDTLTTRNRLTSMMLSLSDEDYEYLRTHWCDMSYIERFWWLHDHGMYSQFVPIQEGNN